MSDTCCNSDIRHTAIAALSRFALASTIIFSSFARKSTIVFSSIARKSTAAICSSAAEWIAMIQLVADWSHTILACATSANFAVMAAVCAASTGICAVNTSVFVARMSVNRCMSWPRCVPESVTVRVLARDGRLQGAGVPW